MNGRPISNPYLRCGVSVLSSRHCSVAFCILCMGRYLVHKNGKLPGGCAACSCNAMLSCKCSSAESLEYAPLLSSVALAHMTKTSY